jgi:hypothetical protein
MRPEDKMMYEISKWRKFHLRKYPCLEYLFHIENEGKREPWVVDRKMIKAGVPDLQMPVPVFFKGGMGEGIVMFCGLWLEVKTYGKKPTKAQLDFLGAMRQNKYYAVWHDNLTDIFESLVYYCELATSEWRKL